MKAALRTILFKRPAVAAPSGAFQTLDAATAGPTVVVSGGGLTITGGATEGACLGVASKSSGKWWVELTVGTIASPTGIAIGLSDASGAETGADAWPGGPGHIGVFASGNVWGNNATYLSPQANTFANPGETVMIEWDADANTIQFNGGSGVQGNTTTFLTNPLWLYVYVEASCSATINCGQSTPVWTPSSGYTGLTI